MSLSRRDVAILGKASIDLTPEEAREGCLRILNQPDMLGVLARALLASQDALRERGDALREIMCVLGPGAGSHCECEGCAYEMREAYERAREAIGADSHDEILAPGYRDAALLPEGEDHD